MYGYDIFPNSQFLFAILYWALVSVAVCWLVFSMHKVYSAEVCELAPAGCARDINLC